MGIIEFILGPSKKKTKKALPDVARGVLEESKPKPSAPDALPELQREVKDAPVQLQATMQAPQVETVFSDQSRYNYSPPEQLEASFFTDLIKHLREEDSIITDRHLTLDEWRSKNLVQEMKTYWDDQRNSLTHLKKTQKLEEELQSNIEELQRLEADWQRLESEASQIRSSMEDKEKQIEVEGLKLKQMLRKWNLKKDVPSQHYFLVKNGMYCKNVSDLLRALAAMDEITYNGHVDDSHNDFANWVRDTMNDKELAEMLQHARTKERCIGVIETLLS